MEEQSAEKCPLTLESQGVVTGEEARELKLMSSNFSNDDLDIIHLSDFEWLLTADAS